MHTSIKSKMKDIIFNAPIEVNITDDNILVIAPPNGSVSSVNLNWFNKKQLNTMIAALEDIAGEME